MKMVFACPKCLELTNELEAQYPVIEFYKTRFDRQGDIEFIRTGEEAFDDPVVAHYCGLRLEDVIPESLVLGIADDTIVVAGDYYYEFRDELEKIAKAHNLKIADNLKRY